MSPQRMLLPLLAGLLFASACSQEATPLEPGHARARQALEEFDPLPNGFDYTARPRFKTSPDGRELAYIRPESLLVGTLLENDFYWLDMKGCPPGEDEFTHNYGYAWVVDGTPRGSGRCNEAFSFTQRGDHSIVLTVSRNGQQRTYSQTVPVKDLLVVALGDSYAAGEGAPDVPGYTANNGDWISPQWSHTPCHRSSKAPSAVLARRLEDEDPRSSVTYLSLACSGATISRETFDDSKPFVEFFLNDIDPDKSRGKGLLGAHAGPESYRYEPAQVSRLKEIVATRQIDALFIGAGGNDMGFSDMLSFCVKGDKLWTHYSAGGIWLGTNGPANRCDFNSDSDSYPHPQRRFQRDKLPERFDALAATLSDVNALNVFLTEYPDPGYAENGSTCGKALWDAPISLGLIGGDIGLLLERQEIDWLRNEFLNPLNLIVRDAAARHQWNFVPGVAHDFAQGHGYCMGEGARWMVKFGESIEQQGPQNDKLKTTGVMHPNEQGYVAIANRMYEAYATTRPDLVLDGTLVRAFNSPEVYVVNGRTRFPIPTPDWFDALGLDPAYVRLVSEQVVSDIPINITANGVFTAAMYPQM